MVGLFSKGKEPEPQGNRIQAAGYGRSVKMGRCPHCRKNVDLDVNGRVTDHDIVRVEREQSLGWMSIMPAEKCVGSRRKPI